MSGFLIMSHLLAQKIPRSLAVVVLGLFSAVLMFRLYLIRTDTRQLMLYIHEQKHLGNLDLPWFGFNPTWALAILGGFVGCIAFFFYRRKTKDEDAELQWLTQTRTSRHRCQRKVKRCGALRDRAEKRRGRVDH